MLYLSDGRKQILSPFTGRKKQKVSIRLNKTIRLGKNICRKKEDQI